MQMKETDNLNHEDLLNEKGDVIFVTKQNQKDPRQFEHIFARYKREGKIIDKKPCMTIFEIDPPLDLNINNLKIDNFFSFLKKIEENKDSAIFLCGEKVFCYNGLIVRPKYDNYIETRKYYNNLITIFNLMGIPLRLDIANDFYFVFEIEDAIAISGFNSGIKIGSIAQERINIGKDELKSIFDIANKIFELIKQNNFLDKTNVHKYLALGKNSYFQNHYELSLIYNWIFIEAIILKTWEDVKHNIDKKTTKEKNKSEIVMKIDDLSELKFISNKDQKILHDLRKKRNGIFHFKTNNNYQKVRSDDAIKAKNVASKLFSEELDFTIDDNFIDFDEIRKLINDQYSRKFTDIEEFVGF